MSIYSKLILPIATASVIGGYSQATDSGNRIVLPVAKIQADNLSPAYSAIEDALSIQQFIKKDSVEKKERVIKVQLKGMKISAINEKSKAESVAKVHLRGEVIETQHFIKKFLSKKPEVILGSLGPQWNLDKKPKIKKNLSKGSSMIKEVELSSGVKVSQVELGSPESVYVEKKQEKENKVVKVSSQGEKKRRAFVTGFAYEPQWIKGNLFVEGGVVTRGEEYFYYFERVKEGKVFEAGVQSANENKYKLEVGDLSGRLNIELRNEFGEMLAYGEKELRPGVKGKNYDVTLYPSDEIFSGRVLLAAKSNNGKEIPATKAQIQVDSILGELNVGEDGYFNENLFSTGSSVVSVTKKEGLWPELKLSISGKPIYPRLQEKNALEILSKNIDPFGEEIEIQNALIAEVTHRGLAQPDLEIKILGMDYNKPVYYGENNLPNPQLTKTSQNSRFAFVNIPAGGYLIQVYRGKNIIAQKWFMVREKFLSTGQIELSHQNFIVSRFESFPRQAELPNKVSLVEVGSKKETLIYDNAEEKIDLVSNPEFALFEIEAGKKNKRHLYFSLSKAKKKVFKVISSDWLNDFLNYRRSNANRSAPMVIGFINEGLFKVIKETSTALTGESKIYYFDRNGDFVDEGVPGGGFLITEAREGFHSTVIKIRGHEGFLNKITYLESGSMTIFE